MSRLPLSLAFATALAFMHTAAADEPYTITIPDQGWTIKFESPPLRQFQGETNPKSSSSKRRKKNRSTSPSLSNSRKKMSTRTKPASITIGHSPSATH